MGTSQDKRKATDVRKEVAVQDCDIFGFLDYREYLRAFYKRTKDEGILFSHRYFARISGLSRSYLKMIMDGRRNLSPQAIAKFARALKLGRKEVAYFEALVLYNQAQSEEERDRHFERILLLRPSWPIKGMMPDQYECFTKTYFVEIREMAAMPDFEDNAEWICRHLRRPLKPREVRHALEVLERLGLLVRDADGRLKHSGTTLATPVHAESLDIFNYHRQLLSEAKEAMAQAPFDEWDVGSMTIPMPKEALPRVMEMLKGCREEIADFVNRGSQMYHEVFQVNMQLFPVSRINQTKDKKGVL